MTVLGFSVGRFLGCWLTGRWQSVWVSQALIAAGMLVFIGYLLSVIANGRKRTDWRELYWQETNAEAIRVARSQAIRDFQAAMVQAIRAERQARKEAAQRPVRAARLEIEGNCIDNG